jgi:hypothetical protein
VSVDELTKNQQLAADLDTQIHQKFIEFSQISYSKKLI